MTDPGPIRLMVEVDRLDPRSGRVGKVSGPLQAFSGWIGLAAALDRVMREEDSHMPDWRRQPSEYARAHRCWGR